MGMENFAKAVMTETEKTIENGITKLENLKQTKLDIDINDRIDLNKKGKSVENPFNIDINDRIKPPTYDGLTEKEKIIAFEITGYSNKILDNVYSMKEVEIYHKAGLVEAKIGDKICLIRKDIDMNQKDSFGKTNAERMKEGLAPIGKDGKPIELHHIGQKKDAPLAELTHEEHHQNGNYTILHDDKKPSEVDHEGQDWQDTRRSHWIAMSEEATNE